MKNTFWVEHWKISSVYGKCTDTIECMVMVELCKGKKRDRCVTPVFSLSKIGRLQWVGKGREYMRVGKLSLIRQKTEHTEEKKGTNKAERLIHSIDDSMAEFFFLSLFYTYFDFLWCNIGISIRYTIARTQTHTHTVTNTRKQSINLSAQTAPFHIEKEWKKLFEVRTRTENACNEIHTPQHHIHKSIATFCLFSVFFFFFRSNVAWLGAFAFANNLASPNCQCTYHIWIFAWGEKKA